MCLNRQSIKKNKDTKYYTLLAKKLKNNIFIVVFIIKKSFTVTFFQTNKLSERNDHF